ncbi:SRPBCC family protein [Streptomyces sp. AM 2-1-1]|uniref:SRPBCC family protein n=1 Tax=unclassified Streptomyces TaxID=2593676 RepID=UPI0023B8B542|nr:SRPBCC family protein [Streptomyces sp. AM 2-1-1]WEH42794.1 SRPBCC family protein [Streptomyces sp. AM 2-1-1]
MDLSHYTFTCAWDLPAPPAAVLAVLECAEEYPRWWPQVREVVPLDAVTGRARFRSVLPYDLVVTLERGRRDPAAGVLEVSLTGDLEGWARWTVTGRGGGSRVGYEQEVDVRKRLMRLLAPVARPAFRANHALMMRAARRGLTNRLATV